MGKIIDGEKIAQQLFTAARRQRRALERRHPGQQPGLGILMVGDNPVSLQYVGRKLEKARQLGIRTQLVQLPVRSSLATAQVALRRLRGSPGIGRSLAGRCRCGYLSPSVAWCST